MDDETILSRGGTERDIEEYANQNGGETTTTSWEEEFDELTGLVMVGNARTYEKYADPEAIKGFIMLILSTQKRELREKIENAPGFLVFKSTEQGEAELPCMTKRSIIALLNESSS